jgi:hypothetical protein
MDERNLVFLEFELDIIAVAIKVRTFFNGPNDHVSVINFLPYALCLMPFAFCYTYIFLSISQ